MSLLLEAPATAAEIVAAPRRRWPVAALAALCALVGIVASLVLVAPGAASFSTVVPSATGVPYVTVPEFGPRGSYVLGYEHGATVRLSLPLHNSGRLPVTVTAVDLGGGPAPLITVRGHEGLPMTLRPGGSGELTLTISMGNCRFYNEREMQTYDGIRVEFSSLGRSGERLLPFDRPILVKSPMIVTCPDRKLDRSLNRRSSLL
ncbi:MAG: hypothetical protein JJD92_09545 [Frankiaceae bacterium]|nr:hypothetical protein [Frankiaceae bacterium]